MGWGTWWSNTHVRGEGGELRWEGKVQVEVKTGYRQPWNALDTPGLRGQTVTCCIEH